jgi:hypothetical protein
MVFEGLIVGVKEGLGCGERRRPTSFFAPLFRRFVFFSFRGCFVRARRKTPSKDAPGCKK